MEVYLNNIRGIEDAICTLYISKRNLTKKLEDDIRKTCSVVLGETGFVQYRNNQVFNGYMEKLLKYGMKHHTLLTFVDFSCTVYGLHRGGQDDFDSHAKRLNNCIVRSSTRLSDFKDGEKSDYYKGKILTTNEVLAMLNIDTPERVMLDGKPYVKTVNGYILESEKDNHDVKRGLYMLSIPSNFTFKCDIANFAHIVTMRDKYGTAAPELQEMIEMILTQLNHATAGYITREFLYEVERWTLPSK